MKDMKLKENNEGFWIKVFSLFIITSLFLHQYQSGIPGVSFADLVLGLSSIILLIKYGLKIKLKTIQPLAIISFASIFLTLVSFLIQGFFDMKTLTRLIRYNYYIYLLLISFNYFNLDYALKVYKTLSLFVSIYIILQFIVYNTIGVILPIKILPISLFREIDLNYMKQMASVYYFRPSGIFVEPGYTAHFLLPALAFSLKGWNNKNKVLQASIIYISMILTTSAQAILLASFTVVFYVALKLLDSKNYKTLIKYLAIFILLGFLGIPIMRLDSVQIIINRFNYGARAGGSAALRLYRGYAIYGELPLLYKLIGVGHGNIGNFVTTYNIFTKYDIVNMSDAALDYVNGVSSVLLCYGLLGLSLTVNYFIKLIRGIEGHEFLTIFFTFIILNFMEGAIFGITMVFYISILFGGLKITKYKKESF